MSKNNMKIKFKMVSEKEIQIVNGRGNKVLGQIFTPSGSGRQNEGCIQVCGFTDAFDLWGCGVFARKMRIRTKKNAFKFKQVKDIQLKFDRDVETHHSGLYKIFKDKHGFPKPKKSIKKCERCFNHPCSCDDKKGKNPYRVKREYDVR